MSPPKIYFPWLSLFAGILISGSASAALINLTNNTSFATTTIPGGVAGTTNVPLSYYTTQSNTQVRGAKVDGALLLQGGAGSGSGVYRRLFNLNDNGTVLDGYNRGIQGGKTGGEFESTVFSNPGPAIRISDLVAYQGFYIFALDVNEPSGGSVNRYISLDEIQLFVGGAVDPTLPTTVAGLPTLGTKVWDLQANPINGSRNDVLVDYSVNNGSGTDDVLLAIPTSLFNAFASNSLVYLYAKHGELGTVNSKRGLQFNGFQTDGGGFDEWASYTTATTGTPPPFSPPIPEPSTALIALLAGSALLMQRRRA